MAKETQAIINMQELITKLKAQLAAANSRNLLNIGMAVFLIVLVSIALTEPGKEKDKNAVFLTDLKQSDIDEIKLIRATGEHISLRKKHDVWYMVEPYSLPANTFRAQSVSALAELKSHLQYDASKVDLKQFKLDKPDVTIVLNDDIKLDVGGVDPINNRRYVKHDDTLHLVTDNFYYQIIGQVTAYISYQLLPPETELTKLVLPKFTLTLDKGNWQHSPVDETISADRINEFVDEWRHAQSLEISDYKGRPRKTDITILYKDQIQPLEFSIMRSDDSTYLIRKDLKLSYKLSDETAHKLQNLPEPVEPEQTSEQAPEQAPKQTPKPAPKPKPVPKPTPVPAEPEQTSEQAPEQAAEQETAPTAE